MEAKSTRSGSPGRSRLLLELPFVLDRSATTPLARQLADGIREGIEDGALPDGTALPSSRTLAGDLGVSRGVVIAAYEHLAAAGLLRQRDRAVPTVNRLADPPTRNTPAAADSRPLYDFTAVAPDISLFPRVAWTRAIEDGLRDAPDAALDYAPWEGSAELRHELAGYLGRTRGVRADPERIVITQGFTQALEVLSRVLVGRGARSLAVENPSFHDSFRTVERSGLKRLPIAVDRHGAVVGRLFELDADAALLTPVHQFPMGSVLTASRRREVLRWARESGGLVIEDDYNAEFRYDRTATPALQGLDPDLVVYAGSASKLLAPGVRLGWLVLPAHLVEEVRREKWESDGGSPGFMQFALARMLATGAIDEHLRRVRRVYAQRRRHFIARIEDHLPKVRVVGTAAGLHATALLDQPVDMPAFLAAAARARISVRDLSAYSFAEHAHGQGLVLGYGRIAEASADSALRVLGQLLREHRLPTPSSGPGSGG